MSGIQIGAIIIEAEDANFNNESKSSDLECVILLPYRIPLLDRTYHIKLGQKLMTANASKVEVEHEGNVLVSDLIFNADRYGQISKTRLKFLYKNISCDNLSDELKFKLLNECILVINRILNACALNSDIYCSRKITLKDIYSCYFVCNEKTILYINPFFNDTKTFFRPITIVENKKIEDYLLNNKEIGLIDELLISAEDYLLFENFRMACIEIYSAAEFALSQILEKYHIKIQTPPEEIEKLLENRVNDWTPELTKIDPTITSGKVWSDWTTNCKGVRNDVIHKRKIPKKEEAEDSVKAGKELLEKLTKVLI